MDDKTRVLLAEQHKNTRYDAIELVQQLREENYKAYKDYPENLYNTLIGRIMNLRIRYPEGVEPTLKPTTD